jgi:hypothetical protein
MSLVKTFRDVLSNPTKSTERDNLRGALRKIITHLINTSQRERISELPAFYLQLLDPRQPQVFQHHSNRFIFKQILRALLKEIAEDIDFQKFRVFKFGQLELNNNRRAELIIQMFETLKGRSTKPKRKLEWMEMMSTNKSFVDDYIRERVYYFDFEEEGFTNYGPLAKIFKFLLHEQAAVIKEMAEPQRMDAILNYIDLCHGHVLNKVADDDDNIDDDDEGVDSIKFELFRYFFDFFVECGQDKDCVLNDFATQFSDHNGTDFDETLEQMKKGLENAKHIFMSRDRLGFIGAMQVPMARRKERYASPTAVAEPSKRRHVGSDDASAIAKTLYDRIFSAGPPSHWGAGPLRIGQNAGEIAKYL